MSRLRRMYRNETAVPFSAIWVRVLIVSTALIVVSVLYVASFPYAFDAPPLPDCQGLHLKIVLRLPHSLHA